MAARAELAALDRLLGWRPGHFYSPYPGHDEVRRRHEAIFRPGRPDLPGIDLRADAQLARLRALAPALAQVPYGPGGSSAARFSLDNPNVSGADAAVLHAMLADLRPRRVVEVGSGWSSCVILDALGQSGTGQVDIALIEPHPELVSGLMRPEDRARVELIARPVQDVPIERFTALAASDVLFIDSSHVDKAGSDVAHLVLTVLPALAPGVRVHVHDILHPFEYPLEWVLQGRAWNEAHLLRAFLAFNGAFRIELFGSWLARFHAEAYAAALPGWAGGLSSSLWLARS